MGSVGWLVLQGETCDEDGGLWLAATPFGTLDKAKEFAEKVIREEWGALVENDPGDSLADHKGYVYPGDSIKWSTVYYAATGEEAWVCDDSRGEVRRKITIVKMKGEGERTC